MPFAGTGEPINWKSVSGAACYQVATIAREQARIAARLAHDAVLQSLHVHLVQGSGLQKWLSDGKPSPYRLARKLLCWVAAGMFYASHYEGAGGCGEEGQQMAEKEELIAIVGAQRKVGTKLQVLPSMWIFLCLNPGKVGYVEELSRERLRSEGHMSAKSCQWHATMALEFLRHCVIPVSHIV